MSKKAIGIDLGSTLSEVSIIENGKPTVIVNEEGSRTTPSVISFNNGERKVGESARRQQIVYPKTTVNIIKRFIGRKYDECDEARKHVLYEVSDNNGMPRVLIEGREYSPEELSSMILQKLKKTAEDYCGEKITDAVITVPAYFNDAQRAATKQAGELAGLNVLRVIAEPTAAILSSGIDMKKNGKYMVVDFGGSTLDDSVADVGDSIVEILASNGDMFLGGTDIDKILSDYIVKTYKDNDGVDVSNDAQALSRIADAAEKAKIELSNSVSTDINIPYITIKNNQPVHLSMTITKAKFEQLITPIVDKLISCAKKSVSMANLKYSDLDGILLVGGSCRIPMVQEALTKEFNVKLIKSANLDTCVSEGASIQANILAGNISDNDITLLDVTPLRMGIETMGGVMTEIVPSNTTIPCKKTQVFSTAEDNQPSVTIVVLQGERPMAKDNKEIGRFNLDNILPARRGVPQIEVSFDIDANGILSVSAKDKGTGKEHHITIETKGALSKDEIEKIKNEAKEHEKEDKEAKELADKLNEADALVSSTEKLIDDNGDKLTEDDKKSLKELSDKVSENAKEKNINGLDSSMSELNKKWNDISSKIYQSTSSNENGANSNSDILNDIFKNGGKKGKDDNVQDAEVDEK